MSTDLAAQLVERSFPDSSEELVIGGVGVRELAASFGTPIYVYDAGLVRASWARLRGALPSQVAICYSVKANPLARILAEFHALGARFEIASVGELEAALATGCAPEHVLFAGPGKSVAELERAVEVGIGEIHVESTTEIERLSGIARAAGRIVRVAVRVNPSSEVQGGAMQMGGKPAPFGIDEERLDEVVDLVEGDPALHLSGLHMFTGTQILDHEVLLAQYRKGVQLAAALGRRTGRPVETLDFGGGLGIPYFAQDQALDVDALGAGVTALLDEATADPLLAETTFLVEPGRYLVGEAGVYLMQVNDVKTSREKHFVITDGGMHHHLAASGNLGQVIKRNYPVVVADRLGAAARREVDVVGPLCTPLDVLARKLAVPEVEVGDLVAVLQSGAYGRSASPLGFLSHPAPAEVWVDSGTASLADSR